ncbi:MAG: glycine--tRNA ligase subunit beta [Brevinema sp.]
MPNFLFEIYTEEIPHGVLPETTLYFKEQVPKLLSKYGLSYTEIQYFSTPRRLAFHISDLPSNGQDRMIEQKGPSLKAAYDEHGKPTKALEGFFSSYHISSDDVEEREIKGQKYIFLQKKEEGLALQEILPPLLQELIQGIKFTQPMRWNYGGEVYEFIRPVRGIVALIDQEILPVCFFGKDSDRLLYGHRQLFPDPVVLDHADDYEQGLKKRGCISSFEERQTIIEQETEKCITQGEALLDKELLSILASLTEYPHSLLADFDPVFLKLPKEVLISEMKIHQKYIPIVDLQGQLLPHYIITANVPYEDAETRQNILAGNARVLQARFADGQFFFDEDIKKGLEYYADQLASVSFVEGAGSMADKVERMKSIALYLRDLLAPQVDMDDLLKGVSFAKADLSSLMVGEFPELQGIIAYYYAKAQGIEEHVALALKEHYYPMVVDGIPMMPTQELSALIGFADRLDNLLTLYAVGKTVSGSRDPYGLRRQTIAIIHLLMQYRWEQFSLEHFFDQIDPLYRPFLTIDALQWKTLITDFIKTRLEGVLKAKDMSMETVNAVLSQGIDILLLDISRAEALQTVQKMHPEPFKRLIELYKRISHILKDSLDDTPLQESLLTESAEKELYFYAQEITIKMLSLSEQERLLELVKIEPLISAFFDSVMVKTGDEKEQNRKALLNMIQQLFLLQADFSKLSL